MAAAKEVQINLEAWLAEKLRRHSGHAADAFRKLCRKCDAGFLAWRYAQLTMWEHHEARDAFFSLDSWIATGGLNLDDLRRLSERAKELWEGIRRLRSSPLVAQLAYERKIRKDDLLNPFGGCPFEGLFNIAEFAEAVGPQKRPDYNEMLEEIVRHVKERTGKYADTLLSRIHEALDLPQPTPEAMKQWRTSRGIAERKR